MVVKFQIDKLAKQYLMNMSRTLQRETKDLMKRQILWPMNSCIIEFGGHMAYKDLMIATKKQFKRTTINNHLLLQGDKKQVPRQKKINW